MDGAVRQLISAADCTCLLCQLTSKGRIRRTAAT